jgi:hypothetical protein
MLRLQQQQQQSIHTYAVFLSERVDAIQEKKKEIERKKE